MVPQLETSDSSAVKFGGQTIQGRMIKLVNSCDNCHSFMALGIVDDSLSDIAKIVCEKPRNAGTSLINKN